MATIALNGFEMYFEDRGHGEPLLLLHGGMGIGDDWRHVFPRDPEGYRVVVPDLRGHGRSSSPDEAFSIRRCASDVLSLLDQLDIRRAKAIGLSLGAKSLLHVSTAQPDRVTAMVLVSGRRLFHSRCAPRRRSSHGRPSSNCPSLSAMRCEHATSTATSKSPGCTT